MGIIKRPVTEEEVKVAKVSLSQPLGQVDTLCEHIRQVYDMAKKVCDECLVLTIYARRMDAKLQKFNQGDYEI
jgi:hypothetical protein